MRLFTINPEADYQRHLTDFTLVRHVTSLQYFQKGKKILSLRRKNTIHNKTFYLPALK